MLLDDGLPKVILPSPTGDNFQKSTKPLPDCPWVWGAPTVAAAAPRLHTTATKPAPAWRTPEKSWGLTALPPATVLPLAWLLLQLGPREPGAHFPLSRCPEGQVQG